MSDWLRIPSAVADDQTRPTWVVVLVEMLNDAGERAKCVASACTVDEAVHEAERAAYAHTGDDSWAMNEWSAVR